MAEHNNK